MTRSTTPSVAASAHSISSTTPEAQVDTGESSRSAQKRRAPDDLPPVLAKRLRHLDAEGIELVLPSRSMVQPRRKAAQSAEEIRLLAAGLPVDGLRLTLNHQITTMRADGGDREDITVYDQRDAVMDLLRQAREPAGSIVTLVAHEVGRGEEAGHELLELDIAAELPVGSDTASSRLIVGHRNGDIGMLQAFTPAIGAVDVTFAPPVREAEQEAFAMQEASYAHQIDLDIADIASKVPRDDQRPMQYFDAISAAHSENPSWLPQAMVNASGFSGRVRARKLADLVPDNEQVLAMRTWLARTLPNANSNEKLNHLTAENDRFKPLDRMTAESVQRASGATYREAKQSKVNRAPDSPNTTTLRLAFKNAEEAGRKITPRKRPAFVIEQALPGYTRDKVSYRLGKLFASSDHETAVRLAAEAALPAGAPRVERASSLQSDEYDEAGDLSTLPAEPGGAAHAR